LGTQSITAEPPTFAGRQTNSAVSPQSSSLQQASLQILPPAGTLTHLPDRHSELAAHTLPSGLLPALVSGPQLGAAYDVELT
jgi:hypothetical protein